MFKNLLATNIINALPETIAIILSAISLGLSIKNYKFNKKANEILKIRFDNESPKIELYIYDQLLHQENQQLLYFFSVLVSNMSNKRNSIYAVELEVFYRIGARISSMKFDCDMSETYHDEKLYCYPLNLMNMVLRK